MDQKTLSEILNGLLSPQKTLPAKLLYDEKGSLLFEEICETEEYAVTRQELSLLQKHALSIAEQVAPGATLVEFGSGASRKTTILLENLRSLQAYIPIDISRKILEESSRRISQNYPALRVAPLCADFTEPLETPLAAHPGIKLGFMPGSTLGNFDPPEAIRFLARTAQALGPGALLLLGIDQVKDRATLEAAYNDRKNVTARFNLNVLERLNREFGANFNPAHFSHVARFNEDKCRIEMHLRSEIGQIVSVQGFRIPFRTGESIHTENSYKYTTESFRRIVEDANTEISGFWSDERCHFSVYLLRSRASGASPIAANAIRSSALLRARTI